MNKTPYDHDFYAWTQEQAALLRAGRLSEVDLAHLAEEIEDMGKSEKRTLESRLEVLLMHLLKWQFQPVLRSRSWELTIKDQRRRLDRHLRENPSLRSRLAEIVADVYPSSAILAERETGLDGFPDVCPFTIEQLFDDSYFPQ